MNDGTRASFSFGVFYAEQTQFVGSNLRRSRTNQKPPTLKLIRLEPPLISNKPIQQKQTLKIEFEFNLRQSNFPQISVFIFPRSKKIISSNWHWNSYSISENFTRAKKHSGDKETLLFLLGDKFNTILK